MDSIISFNSIYERKFSYFLNDWIQQYENNNNNYYYYKVNIYSELRIVRFFRGTIGTIIKSDVR